jgi:TolB-like protein/Tfp pilus assembly protein PilF
VIGMPTEPSAVGVWVKLRRRKVAQWGIAYVAGAWALLQGIDFLVDAFHWPDATRPLATLVLLLGLPVAVALAWYHGDRGEQRVSTTEATIIALLLLLGGGFIWVYQHQAEPAAAVVSTEQATSSPGLLAPADGRPSIAVLPFENRSRLEDDVFFVDGIHDDILTQLSKVSALKVISRTSVERFRETALSLQEIAQQLGVTQVLEGGVQRAGNRVRISVQLIDARTDAHLWAESYDRELTAANIFTIQSEVATAISEALKASLTADERTRINTVPTQSLEAWEAYQLGKQRMARRTSTGLAEAQVFLHRAIDLDPGFALAYVGLADTTALQTMYGGAPRAEGLSEAEAAAEMALQRDPDLAEAWASAAFVAAEKLQYDRAELMFRRAIDLNPNSATAQHWFSDMLGIQGRREEALRHAQNAVELDPLSAIINYNLGSQLESLGRLEEAEARYRKLVEIDPLMPAGYMGIATIRAYALNRFADAVHLVQKAIELDAGNPRIACWLALLYLDLGDDRQSSLIIEAALESWPDHPFVLGVSAAMQLYRGDEDATGRLARKAFASNPRDPQSMFFLGDANLQPSGYQSARARYDQAYPELLVPANPKIDGSNYLAAINLVPILQQTGETEHAIVLLDRSEAIIRTLPRLTGGSNMFQGYGVGDARIFALRGQNSEALARLREAEKAGWRGPIWRYYRDFDPALSGIRDHPEFKAVFADIERDMAAQRVRLEAREEPQE